MNWIFYLDLGLGNGLRNEYAIANAKNNHCVTRRLVSTSYISIFFFVSFLAIIFLVVNPYLNWNVLLHTGLYSNFNLLIYFIVFAFLLRFLFQLINFILLAEQKSYVTSIFPFISNFLIICFLYIYKNAELKIIDPFTFLVVVSSLIPLLVVFIFNLYFFYNHRDLWPRFTNFDFSLLQNLFLNGIQFFFLQVSSIVIFALSNIIIIYLLDGSSVADYNIVFQLFGYITTFFLIFISPYWSAYTDAFHKGDYKWMKKTYSYIKRVWLLVILLSVLFLLNSRFILNLWVGDQVKPSNHFLILNAVYVVLFSHMAIHNQIVNGIGQISLQLRIAFITTLVFVPLSYVFIKYFSFGLNGILLSMIFCMLPYNILISLQVKKLLRCSAATSYNG
jgi:O-antigen/teichoic acid export membrane protein